MKLKAAVVASILALCGARPASAQAPYVGVSLIGDIVRTSHAEGAFESDSGSGESIGFAIKVGAPVGANWGVELEFVRPSEIESTGGLAYPLYQLASAGNLPSVLQFVDPSIPTAIFPIPSQIERRDRYTTLSPVLWASQTLSDKVMLVYLGGAAFNRTEREFGYTFNNLRPISFSKTIEYGVRPMVGFESWIGLSDHLTLVPGIRLHGIQDGWLVRPAVGVSWSF